jgi:histidyl-tRNA synthetase
MTKQKLPTQPYKGARDFYPEDMQVRNYIFDTWRKVCERYGFEEYDPPLLESWDIYAEKTGEEIVNNQLYWFEDKGERKIAIRPEKTPSLARMVASKVKELPKPLRWFNIGNCWRFEKPQKGRGREFYQLDCDILGEGNLTADAEVFTLPVEIMKEFGATEKMFEIRFNNRKFIDYFLKDIVGLKGGVSDQDTQAYKIAKVIDSKPKMSDKEYLDALSELKLDQKQIQKLEEYGNSKLSFVEKYANKSDGAKELLEFANLIDLMGYKKYFKYAPEIARGIDYYTGIVIEQFDLTPENNRSMFGGGRYDDLVGLFSNEELTGVGWAMGDITLLNFLENWDLIPEFENKTEYLVTLWPEDTENKEFLARTFETAKKLREKGKNTQTWLEPETKLDKQLSYADKKNIKYVVIIGPEELEKGSVIIKNLRTGEQVTKHLNSFLSK